MNRLLQRCAIVISILMLLFAIGFNLRLYRAEPTAMVDPNDNAFQYALVARTNEIWAYADKTCPKNLSFVICHLSLLIDHWVPNWAEGYNLPYYYSHVPQIAIVGSYRLINSVSQFTIHNSQFTKNASGIENLNLIENCKLKIVNLSLFEYYHWIIYLLLCLFPLSVFLSIRILKLPWLTAGVGALLATQISTDGLYGLDPSSFLWRGWGLSSQLFSAIFLPLALANIIRLMINDQRSKMSAFSSFILHPSSFILSVLFITLTTMGHLGMGLMLFLAIPVVTFTKPILTLFIQSRLSLAEIKTACIQTVILAFPPLLLLSYWILPTVLNGQYHNISFWDPVWKFNSYGVKEIMINLTNGDLFDFGRLPFYTGLVFIGFFVCLIPSGNSFFDFYKRVARAEGLPRRGPLVGILGRKPATGPVNYYKERCDLSAADMNFASLSFLFLFFLLLYFGRTTWGALLTIIPGMNEFHQHRFIVGVHLMGLFLAPIGFTWIVNQIYLILKILFHKFQITNSKSQTNSKLQNHLNISSFDIDHCLEIGNWKLEILYYCLFISLSLGLFLILTPQTIRYARFNDELIQKANAVYLTQKSDADLLLRTLETLPPGRVFAGRGGGWGKSFRVTETPYYMYLSTSGIPTVLWLPQTWSLNSDTEQYFSEDNQSHYDLYNIRYVVAPPTQPPQKFWKLLKETENWRLYEVATNETQDNKHGTTKNQEPGTTNYMTVGTSPAVVFSDKLSFGNVIRLWIQSDYPKKELFPELRLGTRNQEPGTNLPHFSMIDEATYKIPEGDIHSLFAQPPKYMTPWEWPQAFSLEMNKSDQSTNPTNLPISIINQSSDTDMVFRATVVVSPDHEPRTTNHEPTCPTCVVVLKETYHPNWKATVRKISSEENLPISLSPYLPISTIQVFPSFLAVRLEEPGEYEVVFSYHPSELKQLLFFGVLVSLLFMGGYLFSSSLRHQKRN